MRSLSMAGADSVARGITSYLWDYVRPPRNLMAEAGAAAAHAQCGPELQRDGAEGDYVRTITEGGIAVGAVYRRTGDGRISALQKVSSSPERFIVVSNTSIKPILDIHDVLKPEADWPLDPERRLTEELIKSLAAYLLITLAIMAVMVWLGMAFARRISGPIEKLAATANRINDGTSNVQADVEGNDEIAQLASSLNDMLARIDVSTREKVLERELEAYETSSRVIRHENSNALQSMQSSAEYMLDVIADHMDAAQPKRTIEPEILKGKIEVILRSLKVLDALNTRFKAFAELPKPEVQERDVCEVVNDALNQVMASKAAIRLKFEAIRQFSHNDIIAEFDPIQLHTSVVNLIKKRS